MYNLLMCQCASDKLVKLCAILTKNCQKHMIYCRIVICEVDFASLSPVISPGKNSINLAIWPPLPCIMYRNLLARTHWVKSKGNASDYTWKSKPELPPRRKLSMSTLREQKGHKTGDHSRNLQI